MKTFNRFSLTCSILIVFASTIACKVSPEQKSAETTKPVASNANNVRPAEAVKVEPVKPEVGDATGGSLATPTDTYKTAYAARKKKDVAGLKRAFSKDLLGFFKEMGESEKKTLDESLNQMLEQPMAPTDQVRNEKIDGETATLEYLDDKGKWSQMDFIKEGADWKMTFPKAGGPMSKDSQKK